MKQTGFIKRDETKETINKRLFLKHNSKYKTSKIVDKKTFNIKLMF